VQCEIQKTRTQSRNLLSPSVSQPILFIPICILLYNYTLKYYPLLLSIFPNKYPFLMVLIIVQGEGFGPPILQYGFLVYVVMYPFCYKLYTNLHEPIRRSTGNWCSDIASLGTAANYVTRMSLLPHLKYTKIKIKDLDLLTRE
jgi:hypothetical protein